ncbi:hypothetical protein FHG68_19575 [Leptospira weilii]|nr:hypothetical protein FHG67_19530 [Leptospira weilii]QDK28864.1 hypothetical protein FHG68_19575 [Leptospira weilii]
MICSLRVAHHPTTQKSGWGPIASQRICRNSDRFIFGSEYLWVALKKLRHNASYGSRCGREQHFSF